MLEGLKSIFKYHCRERPSQKDEELSWSEELKHTSEKVYLWSATYLRKILRAFEMLLGAVLSNCT